METEEWRDIDIERLLMPDSPGVDIKSRIKLFATWMIDGGFKWNEPNLELWKAALLSDGKAKNTIRAYLSTIRTRYKKCVDVTDEMRDMLYCRASKELILNDNEEWRDIPDFPGYKVSNQGRVASYRMLTGSEFGVGPIWEIVEKPQRLLKPSTDKRGYRGVNLQDDDGETNYIRINILVLLAFVGLRPDEYECCHNDGNPKNNHLDNLRWDTRQGNQNDRCSLPPELLTCLRYQVANGENIHNLTEAYSVNKCFIVDVCSGKRFSTLGSGPITKKEDINTRKVGNGKIIQAMKLIKNGMMQKEAARIVGVHESTVSRWINGHARAHAVKNASTT